MIYEYTGLLKGVSGPPAESERAAAESVVFAAADLAQWTSKDFPEEKDWCNIPVHRMRKENVVRLSGRFDEVRRMDSLPAEHLGYWVPLGTLGWKDERLPIDVLRFPVIEVTYRCLSEGAVPAILWTYRGGENRMLLPAAPGWRTVATHVSPAGFPAQVDGVLLRLYSSVRATASVEVETIRFRAMTSTEEEAFPQVIRALDAMPKPREYPLLKEFLPLGVCMDAAAARRLAEMLGISMMDYWWLAFEDIVKHHHNSIALANLGQLTDSEQSELLGLAEAYGIRMVVTRGFVDADNVEDRRDLIQSMVKPLANSRAILAWQPHPDASEETIANRVDFRMAMEEADSYHPVATVVSSPAGLPVASRHFAVAAFRFTKSHAPWELGRMVSTHVPLARCQQVWVYAPAFVGPTGTPEWSTCPEMRLMVNLGLANGARGWFSCSYHNEPAWAEGLWQRSLTGPFLAFSDLWAELDIDMNLYNAIAPLLLYSEPEEMRDDWQIARSTSGENALLPEGMPPTSSFRLRGSDYELLVFISNDTRGMTGLDICVPDERVKNIELHDLGDFVRTRKWTPMPLNRHIEMFPGQARIILAGPLPVCAWWRNALAARLVDDDRRQIRFNIDLARAYGLDTRPVEDLIGGVGGSDDVKKLEIADQASDMLVDLLYSSPATAEARSCIIDATAAVCACDGVLCRLMGRGKIGQAQDMGRKVIPLAQEFTSLRIELRKGRGAGILEQARDLVRRSRVVLEELRAIVEPPNARRQGSNRPL